MRLYPNLLSQHLEKTLAPVYVLYGPELFLIEESAALIRKHCAAKGIEHLATTLDHQISQGSLFAQTQLIEIRLPAKLSSSDIKKLTTFLQPSTGLYFLIIAGALARPQQSAWFTKAEQVGVCIAHWPLTGLSFLKWVQARAKQHGLNLSSDNAQQLVYSFEGNCLAAWQEIKRLSLDPHPFAGTLSQSTQFEAFDLCEAILLQQSARVVKILSGFKASETVPLQLIIWTLGQTVRAILQCIQTHREEIQRQILKQTGILSLWQDTYVKALKNPNLGKDWGTLLPLLSLADKQLKSGFITIAWRSILEICLKMSGTVNIPLESPFIKPNIGIY